ncbi:hypothetical protein TRFO_14363 [Tritrichomonas foetus]|uniref:Uncharacterized protein n=1 Tax=Tritrichomonas foetus TaxID=1144522 RepID=A0A1J4KZR0_9EUKA|nr:hypothetical protein TRFO_14363 [Tritrichomonas foetus]|eukprot:OHT15180.1 hypothetical protein TRFO_14363 [Tritrichomonas foetus]
MNDDGKDSKQIFEDSNSKCLQYLLRSFRSFTYVSPDNRTNLEALDRFNSEECIDQMTVSIDSCSETIDSMTYTLSIVSNQLEILKSRINENCSKI